MLSLTFSEQSMEDHLLTVKHSTSYNRTQNLRPCCSCLPSFCRLSLAEIVHSPPPAAHRKECRQSPCRFHRDAIPEKEKGMLWNMQGDCCFTVTELKIPPNCPGNHIFNCLFTTRGNPFSFSLITVIRLHYLLEKCDKFYSENWKCSEISELNYSVIEYKTASIMKKYSWPSIFSKLSISV